MKKITLFITTIILSLIVCTPKTASSQNDTTNGTLDFSFVPTEPSGGYYNKIVLAIWLEDSATGNFIKTKIRYANTYMHFLNVWIQRSSYNVVDAITGPTTNISRKSFTWNGTDINGNLVPDGKYKVWIQMSDKNSNGPTVFCTFVKGQDSLIDISYPDNGNFTQMKLSWKPDFTSIKEKNYNYRTLSCYPNPATQNTTITYNLKQDENVKLLVMDGNGKIINNLIDQVGDKGINTINWKLDNYQGQKVKTGIYYIVLINGNNKNVEKILVY